MERDLFATCIVTGVFAKKQTEKIRERERERCVAAVYAFVIRRETRHTWIGVCKYGACCYSNRDSVLSFGSVVTKASWNLGQVRLPSVSFANQSRGWWLAVCYVEDRKREKTFCETFLSIRRFKTITRRTHANRFTKKLLPTVFEFKVAPVTNAQPNRFRRVIVVYWARDRKVCWNETFFLYSHVARKLW